MGSSSATASRSRRTAVWINVAKVALLGALAPPVVGGITERASALSPSDAAALVALTTSGGAIGAVLGAIIVGLASDATARSRRSRWLWVAGAASLGTLGLTILSRSSSPIELLVGWVLAQFCYSGAMAVLRALLAGTLDRHRKRGAVVVVFAAYGGLAIPLALLAVLPGSVWQVTLGLAIIATLIPLAVTVCMSPERMRHPLAVGGAAEPAAEAAESNAESVEKTARQRVTVAGTLALQFTSASVITALLTFNSVELLNRHVESARMLSVSSLILLVGIVGLSCSSTALLSRIGLLGAPVRMVVLGGALLALSLALRAASDSIGLAVVGAFFSGLAVGLNNSALLVLALGQATPGTEGRHMGQFSAAGAAGQVVGPVLGFVVLRIAQGFGVGQADSYHVLFAVLALLAILWIGATAAVTRPFRRRRS